MDKLRAAVVGLNMGKAHLNTYVKLPEYELVAICDVNGELAKQISAQNNDVPYYLNYGEMLDSVKPDVVSIATPTALHCVMAVEAIEKGVKGIYCEKPMAINMAEARIMANAERDSSVPIIIGHQRRMNSIYAAMRKAVEDGLIGDVYMIRGMCAGDMLSDGTHTVDSLLYLNGDCEVKWLLGQIYRGAKASAEEYKQNRYAYIGTRFGHNVEKGAMAVFDLANGVRCEIFCGSQVTVRGSAYQDIEIFGKKGRIWRNGDSADPPLRINVSGEWEELPIPEGDRDGFVNAYRLFAKTILEGAPHPLCLKNSMRGFEAVMSIYESARTCARIEPPLLQDEFPLDVLLEERGDI